MVRADLELAWDRLIGCRCSRCGHLQVWSGAKSNACRTAFGWSRRSVNESVWLDRQRRVFCLSAFGLYWTLGAIWPKKWEGTEATLRNNETAAEHASVKLGYKQPLPTFTQVLCLHALSNLLPGQTPPGSFDPLYPGRLHQTRWSPFTLEPTDLRLPYTLTAMPGRFKQSGRETTAATEEMPEECRYQTDGRADHNGEDWTVVMVLT